LDKDHDAATKWVAGKIGHSKKIFSFKGDTDKNIAFTFGFFNHDNGFDINNLKSRLPDEWEILNWKDISPHLLKG
jgi:hypothetical protein